MLLSRVAWSRLNRSAHEADVQGMGAAEIGLLFAGFTVIVSGVGILSERSQNGPQGCSRVGHEWNSD
jgi:hypothetical protein